MSQNKKQYARLEPFKKRKVIYLQPYYFQDGAWHKQEELGKEAKNVKRRKSA